jgi:4'-phosphopantetheinyl transferase
MTVEVWFCPVGEPSAGQITALHRLVAPDERHAADRMHVAADRSVLLVAHALARTAVACAAGAWPVQPYQRRCGHCEGSDHGKPALPGTGREFSLAHARGLAGVAVGDRPVGLDLEPAGRTVTWASLGDLVFSPAERDRLTTVDGPEGEAIGLRLWVRKEAALKLAGIGLAQSAAGLDMLGVPPAGAWRCAGAVRAWVRDLTAPPGFAAALATSVPLPPVRIREMTVADLLALAQPLRETARSMADPV